MKWEVVGIDVSKWQGEMNWKVAKPKIHFAYLRASAGANYKDSVYVRNKNECTNLGIPFGAYHFFRADEAVAAQVTNFADVFDGSLPPVLDVEHNGDFNKTQLGNAVTSFIKDFETRTGRQLIIYSRASFWNFFMPKTDWGGKRKLWTAHYTNALSPSLPFDWLSSTLSRKWTFWQWSADGNGLGETYGASGSKSIDLDRYNGTLDDFNKEFNLNVQPLSEAVQIAEEKPDHDRVKVTAASLNIRTQPIVKEITRIGSVKFGTEFDVISQSSGWLTVACWVNKAFLANSGSLNVYLKPDATAVNLIGEAPNNFEFTIDKKQGDWLRVGVFVSMNFVDPV